MSDTNTFKGMIFLLFTFIIFGTYPIYFTLVGDINALEILSHRVIWSCLILMIVLYMTKNIKPLLKHIKDKKTLKLLLIASILISLNWLLFIYAVSQGKILETAIGYYATPLLMVAIGVYFFKEKLNKYKLIALLFAFSSVAYQWMSLKDFPLIVIGLPILFASYAVVKKNIKISGVMSLFIETLFLLPFAILFLFYLFYNNELAFIQNSTLNMSFLLFLSGIVTITPLLLFAQGVQMTPLYVVGFLQYISPTISFLIAIFIYNEELSMDKIITFSLLWIGLSIFIIDELRQIK